MNKELIKKVLIGSSILGGVLLSGLLLANHYYHINILAERFVPICIALSAINLLFIALYRKNSNRS